ncbi:Erythroid membrane-associated protein [Liparis tanakae]|uniref:Erythroid membrane-associated protein n=1 Tax=Liparis tanakae TaxID=230148 RepID=A0A4Z2EI65_9TELE|nr:Erythroid membrane-associated protein [Liparis tanakae]
MKRVQKFAVDVTLDTQTAHRQLKLSDDGKQSRPQKVGVFVDYEEGLVSFYDVEAAALIFSFTGHSFKEKLFPFFRPRHNRGGNNSFPLIISPSSLNLEEETPPPKQSCWRRRGFYVTILK